MAKEDIQTIKDVAKLQQSFDFISSTLKNQDVVLAEILKQAKYTNGRVSALEYFKKYIITGASLIVTAIGLMFPVMNALIKKYQAQNDIIQQEETKKQIQEALASALENYKFQIDE